MNIFLKRLAIFLMLFISLSAVMLFVNKSISEDNWLGDVSSKTVIALGDSNMECAINDQIYYSAINKAASSDSYFYSYLKLRDLIKISEKPDTVLLAFAPHNIFDNGWLTDSKHIGSKMKIYYPLMEYEDFAYMYSINPHAFIAAVPAMISGAVSNLFQYATGKNISPNFGSFLSLDRNILDKVRELLSKGEPLPFFEMPETFDISVSEQLFLQKIISLCQDNNIKLYLINTPKREEILNYSKYGVEEFYRYYDANLKDIDFLDMSKLQLPEADYGDFVHLNTEGSTEFSTILQKNCLSNLYKVYGRK